MNTRLMSITDFFNICKKELLLYYPKYVSNHFSLPEALITQINYPLKFLNTLDYLINDKLIIKCEKSLSHFSMFYRYILPTAIFFHYMHVNLDDLYRLELYICSRQFYSQYTKDFNGEYMNGKDKRTGKRTHIIFVQDHPDNIESSKITLFHELCHVVDNLHFKDFNNAHDIDYEYRWHEIKARYIANFFYRFSESLVNHNNLYLKTNILGIIETIRSYLNDLYHDIEKLLNTHYYVIHIELNHLKFNQNNTNIFRWSKENMQLIESLRTINTLKDFLINVEEILKK